jgi:midasin
MVIVDGVGANPLLSSISIPTKILKANFESKLRAIATLSEFELSPSHLNTIEIVEDATVCGIMRFNTKKGDFEAHTESYNLSAPTTKLNTLRVFRALQITKPILLEGSPGVGKTSLVCKLASLTGNKLIRINLSEQTDLMDLFGSDLPVESESSDSPKFAWRDGPFLQAMTLGYWILLDELNLATQQVLEGLNACLDHRGSVYIPELDKTFLKSPNFRIFAAQNPQGIFTSFISI